MPPKKKTDSTNSNASVTNETDSKTKRGRKSKQDLMASLGVVPIEQVVKPVIVQDDQTNIHPVITFTITEKVTTCLENENKDENKDENKTTDDLNSSPNKSTTNEVDNDNDKTKKRGRKPKGGKIVHHIVPNELVKSDKPNVILHLKCSMKDLQNSGNNGNIGGNFVDSYGGFNNVYCDVINDTTIINQLNKYTENDCNNGNDDDDDESSVCKDDRKEIWRKLKQLEHNLHVNNVANKKCACFWDTCEFDNPPIYIPKHFINGSYQVYGCFCSPECAAAYLMNYEKLDSSTKFERYQLLNNIYSKVYGYQKNIIPAGNPYYMLDKFAGNLSIQEYRSLLRNERLFLIVDKPLTRVLPELHQDNDDFILNNKIIPSNAISLKTKLQRKKPDKNSILNEKFGITNQHSISIAE